jgi:hypothetical protein
MAYFFFCLLYLANTLEAHEEELNQSSYYEEDL